MKRLKLSLLYDNLHFLFILIILLILTIKYCFFGIPLIVYFVLLYKKTPLFNIGVFLTILIVASSFQYLHKFEDNVFSGIVIEGSEKYATVLTKNGKVLIYHEDNINLGDYGIFFIKTLDYDTELFNYTEYLNNKGIKDYYKLKDFKFRKNYFVPSKIQKFFLKSIDSHPSEYKDYIKMLVFAYKEDSNIVKNTQKLGISHLLAVSGMHISLLVLFLEFILKRMFYHEKPKDIIICLFLLGYLVITNFELTVVRAVFMILFNRLFKHKNLLFTSLDNLSLTGIIMLLFNPRYIFLLSFQLSFIVSFVIIIFTKNFYFKNKVIQTYLVSVVAFLVTLPFIINVNYEVNLLSIIIGPIYVLYFELILYPVTLILMVLPNLYLVLNYVFSFFETTISFFSNIKCFNLIFGDISFITFLLYEVLLYFLLVSFELKRGREVMTFLMLFFLSLIYNKNLFNPFYKIKMYDVGQGDSVLVSLPFNQGNIIIDCYNNICEHLKKDGIKKIDIVFLSHGHDDHIGAYQELEENFIINKTYSSYYDQTELLREVRNQYNISLLKSGDKILFKDLTFEILGPIRKYSNENDNSLVMKVLVDDVSILFTGDIEEEAELDLVRRYGIFLKSDILKVSHHGSNTSSSKQFLSHVLPEYFFISVGRNNYYGFPNNKEILSFKNVYRTDKDNSITLYKRKKFFYIEK